MSSSMPHIGTSSPVPGDTTRVRHRYRNTRGVRAAGMAGTGTVWEIPTRGYTVPVTAV